jgi:hypothetical protein
MMSGQRTQNSSSLCAFFRYRSRQASLFLCQSPKSYRRPKPCQRSKPCQKPKLCRIYRCQIHSSLEHGIQLRFYLNPLVRIHSAFLSHLFIYILIFHGVVLANTNLNVIVQPSQDDDPIQPPSRLLVRGPNPLASTLARPPPNMLANRGATAVVTNVDALWENMSGDVNSGIEAQLADVDSAPALKKKKNWFRRKIDVIIGRDK